MSIEDIEKMVNKMSANSVSAGDWEKLSHFADGLDLVVELGTNTGSTAIMLRAMAKRVITVDVFEHTHLIEDEKQREMYENHFKVNGHYFSFINDRLMHFDVVVHCGLSYNFADKFGKMGNLMVDMLFIDADHSYQGVKRDYEAWFSKVKTGGYFAFHDVGEGCEVLDYYNKELLHDKRIERIEYETIAPCWTEVFKKL